MYFLDVKDIKKKITFTPAALCSVASPLKGSTLLETFVDKVIILSDFNRYFWIRMFLLLYTYTYTF